MAINPIGQLATAILATEFDYITGTEATTLLDVTSGWLGANVGQLNILINTSFNSGNLSCTGAGAKGSGLVWQAEEKAIYKQIYLQEYYNKEARKILRDTVSTTATSGTTSTNYELTEWTSLREGDTQIQRQAIILSATQKNESSRIVRSFATDAGEELKRLIHSYNMYNAVPRQVAGNDGEPLVG